MEYKYKLWVARDKNGELYLYNEKPERYNDSEVWCACGICSKLDNNLFPGLKFEDKPVEVVLLPTITYLDAKAEEYANSVTDNEEIKKLIINAFKTGHNI